MLNWEGIALGQRLECRVGFHLVELLVKLLGLLVGQTTLLYEMVHYCHLFLLGHFHLSDLLTKRLSFPIEAGRVCVERRELLLGAFFDGRIRIDISTRTRRRLSFNRDTREEVSLTSAPENAVRLDFLGFGSIVCRRHRESVQGSVRLEVVMVGWWALHARRILERTATHVSLRHVIA